MTSRRITAFAALCCLLTSLPGLSGTGLSVTATATASSFDGSAASLAARVAPFLDAARARTLEACAAKGITLPADFLAWVDGDPIVRTTVYGCRNNPLPVLLGLRSLEIDLGAEIVRRDYTQLALAFAVDGSYRTPRDAASGWNDGDIAAPSGALPDVSPRPPLKLEIPGDPRVRVDTKSASRELDLNDHVINFLEDHAEIDVEVQTKELPPLEYDDKGVAKPRGKPVDVTRTVHRGLIGADVIASPALQTEFNEYMKAHGHPEVTLDCGDRAVHWKSTEAIGDAALRKRIAAAHELFHAAYRAKGRMPAERDRAPTASESMAWFIRNDRHPFGDAERAERKWPLFPLDAPWPVLMMLAADDQPLREREEIWGRFRDSGEMRTYGEYIGGIAQQFDMQSARRVSPFAFSYGSIQMMWKDGGVCGTMGNIGARTWRICGVPASTAGQPGHCAMVRMDYDRGAKRYRCRGEQYATGGDEATNVHAMWNYDDVGGRKPMVFHQSVSWGVDRGLASYLDTLAMRRVFDALPAEERSRTAADAADEALACNPFALPMVEAAIAAAPDAAALVALLDRCNARLDASIVDADEAKECQLYRTTVRDLVHARIATMPPPPTKEASAALLTDLERQACDDEKLLARTWREIDGEDGFVARCRAEVDRYLAAADRRGNKKAAKRFAEHLKALGQTAKGKDAKKAWAESMLTSFAAKEFVTVKGKPSLDPAVEMLCAMAGRPAPTS